MNGTPEYGKMQLQGRVAVVVFSFYPADPRVRRETEALAGAGLRPHVVCLRGASETRLEWLGGVCVHRMPVRRRRGGKLRYIWEYAAFLTLALLNITWLHIKHRFDLVHVHNMPDVLILSALAPKLTGAKLILDLHDPMPEVFMTKYALPCASKIIRCMCWLERRSIAFADLVLTPNRAFREQFVARGCPRKKIQIIMNSPQEDLFQAADDIRAAQSAADQFVVMFHGTLVERHGLATALEALAGVQREILGLRFVVYGDGDFVPAFTKKIDELELNDLVDYRGHVSIEEIARIIPKCDLGLIPNQRSPFTEINFPTRIFEYLCLGKPVIAPRTHGIKDYFRDDALYFFEPGNIESLENALLRAFRDREQQDDVLRRGLAVYRKHTWQKQSVKLLQLVDDLLDGKRHTESDGMLKQTEIKTLVDDS